MYGNLLMIMLCPMMEIVLFVPENKEQWMEIKNEFTKSEKLNKNVYRKFAVLTASIPKSVSIELIKNFCDEELLKHSILLPKFEH